MPEKVLVDRVVDDCPIILRNRGMMNEEMF